MRKAYLAFGSLATLGSAFLATSHCCERLNVLAAVGLTKPGCLGLSQHRMVFAISTLFFLTWTTGFSLYGPGARAALPVGRTILLTLLATAAGFFLFVIP